MKEAYFVLSEGVHRLRVGERERTMNVLKRKVTVKYVTTIDLEAVRVGRDSCRDSHTYSQVIQDHESVAS
jgi:hypothetical protein